MLVGEEGVMTGQGPNGKQRAHPEWDTRRRVCLQRYAPRGTSNSSAIRSQGIKTSGRRDSDQNRQRIMQGSRLEGSELSVKDMCSLRPPGGADPGTGTFTAKQVTFQLQGPHICTGPFSGLRKSPSDVFIHHMCL